MSQKMKRVQEHLEAIGIWPKAGVTRPACGYGPEVMQERIIEEMALFSDRALVGLFYSTSLIYLLDREERRQ